MESEYCIINKIASEFNLDNYKIELLKSFKNHIIEANKKVNLVSKKDIEFLFEHHIFHSLLISKIIKIKDSDTVIDIGTGGGFPGIPLAIFFNKTKFTLIDSINKKIEQVDKIISKLGLKNVQTECKRSENISKKFDIIIGRAVKDINIFYNLTKHILSNTGKIIYLNGSDNKINENSNINVKYFALKNITDIKYYENKQIVEITKN